MKSMSKLFLAGSALLAMFASSAQAQVTAPVTIHINGSTAYRAAVHEAIVQILGSGTCTAAYLSGKTLATSNQAVFKGTVNGQTVVFETDWTGSISGIINTANATDPSGGTTAWLSPSNITGAPANAGGQTLANGGSFYSNFDLNAGPGGGNACAATPTYESAAHAPDVCLSDAFQSSTPQSALTTLSGVTASTSGNAGTINDNENGEIVGVIPFVWLKCAALTTDSDYKTSWTDLTNITNLQAKELLTTYQQPASFFTGYSTDTAPIYVTGRDGDSGTRFSELAETGYGVTSTTHQITYGTVTGTAPYQQETGTFSKNTFKLTAASPGSNVGGYSSGGTLCGFLADYGTDTDANLFAGKGYVVGYAGIADADSALAPSGLPVANNPNYPANYAPAQELSYNGVYESLATISNGTYQGWEYEHFYTLPSTSNPNASNTSWLTVVGNLVGELENTYVVRTGAPYGTGSVNEVTAHVAGYLTSEVTASKNAEGGVIAP